jgi:hypothetical protein
LAHHAGRTTGIPVAGDDAASVELLWPDLGTIDSQHWAFDFHRKGIIADYLKRREKNKKFVA